MVIAIVSSMLQNNVDSKTSANTAACLSEHFGDGIVIQRTKGTKQLLSHQIETAHNEGLVRHPLYVLHLSPAYTGHT